jgi:hypothetical protein
LEENLVFLLPLTRPFVVLQVMTLVVARPFLLNLIPRLPRQPGVYGKQGTRGEAKRGKKWSK